MVHLISYIYSVRYPELPMEFYRDEFEVFLRYLDAEPASQSRERPQS